VNIAAWLQGLGLKRYEQTFRDNRIDADVLAKLTLDDLRDMGIVAVGDRRRILEAIAALHGTSDAPSFDDQSSPNPAIPLSHAERRQLTLMFVDLVGSTELSHGLDPEVMSRTLRAYQQTVAGQIELFDGHVAKYMGDGILAYFGWPKAHEEDAERAVRAGLEIAKAVAQLSAPAGSPLAARIGIATGPVVVGELIGKGVAQEELVVGETPNLAARLQARAQPGTVVIAEGTRRLLGSLFQFADLGPLTIPGFDNPVLAFQVKEGDTGKNRFEALHGQQLMPLIGREHELGLLFDRWQQAREGDGQVVLLAGEPGIGKSRILQSLRDRLSDEPHTHLRYFCSPFHQNTAFYPILDQIERGARIQRQDPPEVKLDKLTVLFGLSGIQTADATEMTAALLGISSGADDSLHVLSPQARKAKIQELWLQQLVGLARRPVLMLLEDAHWIDPSSLDQFDQVIDRIQQLPVLFVITFRPEFVHAWGRHPHVTALSLNRLSQRQSLAMVEQISAGKSLPGEVLQQIAKKADGVPLFLEELTKAVLESGLLEDEGDHWRLRAPLPPLAIPASLHDSLMARLDRLAPVKQVAQIASVIGREFPHDLLATVAEMDSDELDSALAHLGAAEIVFRRSMPPNATYAFKHALLQEAAYASLLHGRRQQLHTRIAGRLQERTSGAPPEIVAHHLSEAGDIDAAVTFWEAAGRQAVARAAGREALAHFQGALAQLAKLPESIDRKRREVALQSAIAGGLVNVTGLASEALAEAYTKARDLCAEIGDSRQQFVIEWGIWHVYVGRAEHRRAKEVVDRLVAWTGLEQDAELALQACHADWTTHHFFGEHAAARRLCERGWELYDCERHGGLAFTFGGHDPGVCSRNQGALAAWCLGYPDQARACYDQGLRLARQLAHPQIIAHALNWGMPLFQLCRDREGLKAYADELLGLATEQEFANYRTDAQILRGWVLSGEGANEATRLMVTGLAERQGRQTLFLHPYYLSLLARAQARVGESGDALGLIREALKRAQETHELWIEPELLRVEGELQIAFALDRTEAEHSLRLALDMARSRGARSWELRTATTLARFWAEAGERQKAHELLAATYGWFTEGFNTPDLKDAQALLEALQ
jgi:class 3 adenylate cyclase/predicted ATPase